MKFFSLKYKLLCYSIVVSVILTILISAIEINYDIRVFETHVRDEIVHFEKDNSAFLASRIWEMDYAAVKRSAANEVGHQVIDKITITDVKGNIIADTGTNPSGSSLTKNFNLVYFHNGENIIIGHVFIGGNVPGMSEAMQERWQPLFIINGMLIATIFLFFYALFYRNVLSRLIDLTHFTNQIKLHSEMDIDIYHAPLKKLPDEIVLLIKSFNNMIKRINTEFTTRIQVESVLEKKTRS